MEHYSAIKRKQSLIHTKTWMHFQKIMLNQKAKDYLMYDSIYVIFLNDKIIEWPQSGKKYSQSIYLINDLYSRIEQISTDTSQKISKWSINT